MTTEKTRETRAANATQASQAIDAVMIWIALTGAVFTVAAFAVGSPKAGLSVCVGALLGVGNLWALSGIIGAMLAPHEGEAASPEIALSDEDVAAFELARPKPRFSAAWAVFAVLKMTILFGGVYLVLTRGWVSGLPMALGYGCMPIGMFLNAIWTSLRHSVRAR